MPHNTLRHLEAKIVLHDYIQNHHCSYIRPYQLIEFIRSRADKYEQLKELSDPILKSVLTHTVNTITGQSKMTGRINAYPSEPIRRWAEHATINN